MQASRILRKSLSHYSLKKQKAIQPFSVSSIFHETENEIQKWTYSYQTRRTLILERSSSQLIKLHRLADADSGIVEVNLDRPERKNAIGKDFLRGFQESLEEISKDSSANVILIRSLVPKVFCAGADLKERREQTPAENESFVNSLRSSFTFLEEKMRAGATQRLPRLIGKAQAKELILTGKRISGTTAMSIGLVNYCIPAGEVYKKALEIAREINEKGPLAIRMAKKAIDEGLEVNMASSEATVKHCYAQLLYTRDRLEGLAAFAEKRKPKYKGE
ncbi:Crotonase superfamily [Parasponia andersonii]|uniref:Crotonase superfamily n=1 Tax=Parasponia andersonii TaxID=3476 RepID=A0A2P5CU72_PARAD|nr:Crotonase superfamily [Parasponia andersonii]